MSPLSYKARKYLSDLNGNPSVLQYSSIFREYLTRVALEKATRFVIPISWGEFDNNISFGLVFLLAHLSICSG
jgi:hypothetical protein